MGMNRNRRRLAAWIACFAVLLASLAPSISHALNAIRLADKATQHDICSLPHIQTEAAGEKSEHPVPGLHALHTLHAGHSHHAADSPDASPDAAVIAASLIGPHSAPHSSHASDHGLHFEHCPFCFTHAGSFGLPPTLQILLLPEPKVSARPKLFYHSPSPLFAWVVSQPRAPPFVS